jgi:hypothetical protein
MLLAHAVAWNDKVVAFSTLAGTIVVVASAVVGLRQLREAERTRLATLISDLTRRWDEPLLRTARLEFSSLTADELKALVQESYANPRGDEDRRYLRLQALPNFFEYLGVLETTTKGLTLELINVLWRSSILSTWRRWEPTITWIRSEAGVTSFYANFERLAQGIWALPDPR